MPVRLENVILGTDGRCVEMDQSTKNLHFGDCTYGKQTTKKLLVMLCSRCLTSLSKLYLGATQQFRYVPSTGQVKSDTNGECLDYHYGNGNVYIHPCKFAEAYQLFHTSSTML